MAVKEGSGLYNDMSTFMFDISLYRFIRRCGYAQ